MRSTAQRTELENEMVVKLRPQWESKTKAGNDNTGWKRGQRGFGGDWSDGERAFMRDGNPAASDMMYGRRGDRPNGQQVVQTKSRNPGTITNDDDKGYRGVDE
jgi:hypothetical protein